jgi:hypothetical protein
VPRWANGCGCTSSASLGRCVRAGGRHVFKIANDWPRAGRITRAHAQLATLVGTRPHCRDPTTKDLEHRRCATPEMTYARHRIDPSKIDQCVIVLRFFPGGTAEL